MNQFNPDENYYKDTLVDNYECKYYVEETFNTNFHKNSINFGRVIPAGRGSRRRFLGGRFQMDV